MDQFYCETQLSENKLKTPEGFLVCYDVPITISGDMYYTQQQIGDSIKSKNGQIKVHKKIEDIHSDETVKSFEGKPITLGHPKDESGMDVFVTPDNAMKLSRGFIQNVRPGVGKDNNKLLSDFVIMDKELIALVEGGLREVSIGYNYEPSNMHDGFFEQTNIRGNHVALVENGRAGPECAIFDSKEETEDMSLKTKIKDAMSVFGKAVDMAVPDDSAPAKDAVENESASDESPMQQAMEDMAMMQLSERIDSLESMYAALCEKMKNMVMGDSSGDSGNYPESAMDSSESETVDAETICKAEILSPGISKTDKDIKRKALDECYKTEEGKKIIDSVLSGQSFDSADSSLLFNAAASLLSAHRSEKIKKALAFDSSKKALNGSPITAAILNKMNEEFYSKKSKN